MALVTTAVIIKKQKVAWRRRDRPRLPEERWYSRWPLVYPGPHDNLAGFIGSPAFGGTGPMPMAWLVLTPTAFVLAPIVGDIPPITCKLASVSAVGFTFAGRSDSGLTITRHDGRVARFLVNKPDERLVRELERLGATVVNADLATS